MQLRGVRNAQRFCGAHAGDHLCGFTAVSVDEDVLDSAAELSGYGYQEEEVDAHAAQGFEEAREHAHGAVPGRAVAHLPGLGLPARAFQAPGCDDLGAREAVRADGRL